MYEKSFIKFTNLSCLNIGNVQCNLKINTIEIQMFIK